MAILKENGKNNVFIFDNEFLLRKDLSLKAKGLLAFLLSLPENEKIYKSELKKYFKDGQTAINTAFNELVEKGYIVVHKKRVNGRLDYDYDIYNIPQTKREMNKNGRK